MTSSPPPHATRRTAAIALAGFCAFVTLYAPQPLLPTLAGEFHTSVAAISLLLTASTLGVAIAAAFAGIIADHVGRKRVIVPAAFLLAVPSLLLAKAAGVNQLIFWRFWQGVFTPGIAVVAPAYISEEWEQGVGAAMGAYVSGTVLGGFSGRIVAGFVAARFSWRASFLILGAIGAAGALAVWAWLPPGRRFERASSTGATVRAMARHLKNPRLIATYAVGFCVLFSMLATFTYVNFYLAAPPFLLSPAALGLLFVVYLAGAVATPVAGRWIDRVGHRTTLLVSYVGAVGGILLTLIHSLPMILIGLALCCSAVFVAQSVSNSYIGTVASEARAAAVGLYVLFYYIGGSAGSAIPGYLWNRGGWPACVALIAAVQIITIAIASAFWKPAPLRGSESLVVSS
ncbi:MAG TPA: MFS transporter [Bryobacteraceae bacterium]